MILLPVLEISTSDQHVAGDDELPCRKLLERCLEKVFETRWKVLKIPFCHTIGQLHWNIRSVSDALS